MIDKKIKLIIALLVSSLMLVGCATESNPSNPGGIGDPIAGDPLAGGDIDSPSSSSASNIVTLDIVGNSALDKVENFEKFTVRSMYDPQNIKLEVNLKHRGDGRYGGTIKIKYTDNGSSHTGTFVNGDDSYYTKHKGQNESAKYNKWFKVNNKWVFHGFFQDDTGGVILVLDGNSGLDLGDGKIPSEYKGSVYYKNFHDNILNAYNAGPHPNMHCWFVSEGPYDCRAWKSGNGVDTYKALYPDNGYTKLGEFENLSVEDSFGVN